MPDYIPEHIRQDYFEACLILDDSPKASATLSRRCLQGIIRDHFKIVKNTLLLEINALKNELSPNLWLAVDSIRKVGNVGAHFEKDVNLIVDISRDSANALIRLIELLFEETYIKDHDQEKRIAEALQAGKNVDQQKNIDIDK